MMHARLTAVAGALGLAVVVSACNPLASPDCYRVNCPYPPVYHASYAGYVPAFVGGRPAFGEPPFDDPFADYAQRSLTISPGAGNAQAANTALQTATPWPRYSSNTNIPGNGAQMVKAVREFETGNRPKLTDTSGGGAAIQINNNTGGAGAPEGAGGSPSGGGY